MIEWIECVNSNVFFINKTKLHKIKRCIMYKNAFIEDDKSNRSVHSHEGDFAIVMFFFDIMLHPELQGKQIIHTIHVQIDLSKY
jgi:hypothetical protein